jgi:hypothetical protein
MNLVNKHPIHSSLNTLHYLIDMKIALIGCVKKKVSYKTKAELLYDSTLFKYSLQYAKQESDKVFILSAKYGLLSLDRTIEPYEVTLNTFSEQEKIEWSNMVFKQIKKDIGLNNQFMYLCGSNYKKYLLDILPGSDPLKGLGLGKRIQWLKNHVKKSYNIFEDV